MFKNLKLIFVEFLRKSQKFTGTDNVYLAKYGSYLTIGNVISVLASFLLAMAFARLLPKETYGEYRYLLSIMTMIGICALPGMGDALLQAVANKLDGCFKKAFREKFKWAILGSLICLIVAGYFFFKNNYNLSISFTITALFFPFMQSTEIYLSYLGGKKLFGIQTKYSVLTQIFAALAIIITLFFSKNLVILVLVYFVSNTLLRSFFLLKSLNKFPPSQENSKEYIKFGKHLSFLRIFHTIAGQIDKILLFHLLGPVQVAIYSFAVLPISEADVFLKNIRLLALPKFSSRTTKEIKKTLLKKVGKGTLLIILPVLLYVFIAPYIYKIFFPQYIESIFYSRLYALSLILFPATLIALVFQAKMMKKELYLFSTLSPLIQILLLIILIPLYGLLGAIIAYLIGQFIGICLALFLFEKK